ncbi:MAG: ArsR/SmtB family transcription factor [Pyrinomonadaceae bacterium]
MRNHSTQINELDNATHAKIFAVLADPTRLQMIEMLAQRGEISSSEIASSLSISLALCCHHSRALCEAGLISKRKDGQTKYYTLNRALLTKCVEKLLL